MKLKITFKHITLAIGILVAVLAAVMYMVRGEMPLESNQAIHFPSFALPKFSPAVIKVFEIIF